MTILRITTKYEMGDSEKYCFDMRCKARGKQMSAKVREYQSEAAASDLEDVAADIRQQWHCKVELIGGHFEASK